MKKIIEPGECVPPFYGIAYRDFPADETICYPLGINLLVILWMDFKKWIKFPRGGFWVDKIERKYKVVDVLKELKIERFEISFAENTIYVTTHPEFQFLLKDRFKDLPKEYHYEWRDLTVW